MFCYNAWSRYEAFSFLSSFNFMGHDYGKYLPAYVTKVCLSTNLLNSKRKWNLVSTIPDPLHYTYEILKALNLRFYNRWIAWARSGPWLPRSLDLSPLVLFLWVFIKILGYSLKIRNLLLLWERINTTVAIITPICLRGIWKKMGII